MPTVPTVTSVAPPPPSANVVAAPGFEAALAASLSKTVSWPSVTLGHMIDALAGGGAVREAPSEPSGAVSTAASIADPWGAESERPTQTGRIGAQVLAAGEQYLGVPYKWGGTTAAGGFDCSGFVQQVYEDLGVKLPRVSVDQARAGRAVASIDDAMAGDLVFWRGNGSRPNHIGIYAGEGRMLVAPRTGDVVKYQEIRRPPDGIRRIIG